MQWDLARTFLGTNFRIAMHALTTARGERYIENVKSHIALVMWVIEINGL